MLPPPQSLDNECKKEGKYYLKSANALPNNWNVAQLIYIKAYRKGFIRKLKEKPKLQDPVTKVAKKNINPDQLEMIASW